MAAGRLATADAARYATDIKALLRMGDRSLLQTMLQALRSAGRIDRVIVVGPLEARSQAEGADAWVEERASGEENALAGLAQAASPHALLCASDLPFVHAQHIDDFLNRIPTGSDVAYPIYERDEFLSAYPAGRSRFARVGRQWWTGGSVCLVNAALAQRHADLIRKSFRARKNPLSLASLYGPAIVLRFLSGHIALEDIERRLSALIKGVARAVRHAHPALGMDCDDLADIEYARAQYAIASR